MTASATDVSSLHGPGQVFELLLIGAHRLAVEMHAELEFDELSTLQLLALRILARANEPMTAMLLAAHLACSRAATSQLVHRLVRDRYLTQVESRSDRRQKLLVPTEGGLRAAELAADALERCIASFSRSFTVEERATFATLLDRLNRGADWHRGERDYGLQGRRTRPPRRRPLVHIR